MLVGDAQMLPLRSAAFDVALALHMLYHVPDRAAAIGELRRVVRPGGVLVVLTNSDSHLRELDDLIVTAETSALGRERASARAFFEFTTENGAAELAGAFDDVAAHPLTSELVLTDVDPVVAYARSMSTFALDSPEDLEAVLAEIARAVAAAIARDGAFRVRTAGGFFVCR